MEYGANANSPSRLALEPPRSCRRSLGVLARPSNPIGWFLSETKQVPVGEQGDVSGVIRSARTLILSLQEAPMRALATILALLVSVPALAAEVPPETQKFVSNVAVANKFEIDTSNLALKYAKSPDVKNFAQQMVNDHTAVAKDFKAALEQAKIPPPPDALDLTHEAKYAKLRLFTTESGFDASYMNEQLKAHEDTVAKFKEYAANGPTPEVKDFAAKTLPTLEHHLSMAKDLNEKLNSKS
jgi:putative membrane protein